MNQGLRGAKALLEQRDKALGALQEANGRLGAEVATMTDAAKKTEKRLLLLKTVSKNLQEARDERDAAAARAEESATQVAELRKEVAAMEALGVRLGETENVVKQRDEELARLTAETTAKEVAHESRIRLVGAVAAAGGAVFGIILRAIVPRSDHREE